MPFEVDFFGYAGCALAKELKQYDTGATSSQNDNNVTIFRNIDGGNLIARKLKEQLPSKFMVEKTGFM